MRFGDASAVNSGRIWSLVTVAVLFGLWWAASAFGWIEPFFWPPIGATWDRLVQLVTEGFRNVPLWEHVGISVFRVLTGVVLGALVGIPLGFAMGLSSVARGIFDPIVEFMRPIPPLALIPLDHPLVRHRRDGEDLPPVPRRALHHDDRGPGRAPRA